MSNIDNLKIEADSLGISYPKNIGEDKLADKIAAFKDVPVVEEAEEVIVPKPKSKEELTLKQTMSKLIRVRVTCNDPQFKKHNGLTRAAGSTTFFRKRFVPFNRETHIEQVIFDNMKRAQYQWFEEKVNRTTGRKYKVPRSSPSFVIEELPALTKAEYDELARDQRSRGSFDD